MELNISETPLAVKRPIRILAMVASPRDLRQLDVDGEKKRMVQAVEHLVGQINGIELAWVTGETLDDLQKEMRKGPWHVFHFIGHGSFDESHGEGFIALANEAGNTNFVDATTLSMFLADHQPMRLVVLNSCKGTRASTTNLFSSTAAVLVRRGIPAVVSMQYEISDEAALLFSRTFYEALAREMPVEAAVTDARKIMWAELKHNTEWGTPVLHLRSPDGVLFPSAVSRDAPQVASPPQTPPSREHLREDDTPPLSGQADSRHRDLMTLWKRLNKISQGEMSHRQKYRGATIDVEIEEIQGPVDNPTGTVPLRQLIGEYFQEVGCSLLILGEPGSGKTTTLRDLNYDLLNRAERGSRQPIPVMLHLSSWKVPPVSDWVVKQLSFQHQIKEEKIRDWLKEHRLLLLFDGLDEVRKDQRLACVDALNKFAPEVGLAGMAVCCRFKEYRALSVKLTLTATVQLKLLSDQQVLQHVKGKDCDDLHTVLQEDSGLRILVRSPFMLGLMMQTYQNDSVAELAAGKFNTSTERRKALIAAYVAQMFRQAAGERT
jgi:hypothetical protein